MVLQKRHRMTVPSDTTGWLQKRHRMTVPSDTTGWLQKRHRMTVPSDRTGWLSVPKKTCRLIRGGSPGQPRRLSHSYWALKIELMLCVPIISWSVFILWVCVCASAHSCFLLHLVVFFVLLAVFVFWVDNQKTSQNPAGTSCVGGSVSVVWIGWIAVFS